MNTQPVEFFGFVEGSYLNFPYAGDRPKKSLNVETPNTYYDPMQGQRALETQLDTLVSLERLGFDGAMVSEQHAGLNGQTPNALVAATWLAARTDRIKVVATGPLMNAYLSPLRLAEEIALVDTLSKGRLTVGLPLGLGMSYHTLSLNPATARARFQEGHDLMVKALREPGPFQWRGRFFHHNYVNLWPRPAHEIEFIMPSGGSLETLKFCAKHRYAYQAALVERKMMIKTLETFREFCREEGYEPDPRQSTIVAEIHVAESDEVARKEYEGRALWNYQNYFQASEFDQFPPGYTSKRSIAAIRKAQYSIDTTKLDYQDLVDNSWVLAGSPETVRDKLEELISEAGAGRVILSFSFGTKPDWLLQKSIGLFAEQVLPHFRKNGLPLSEDEPTHGYRTRLEYAHKRREDLPAPTFVKDGYLTDMNKYGVEGVDARIRPWPDDGE